VGGKIALLERKYDSQDGSLDALAPKLETIRIQEWEMSSEEILQHQLVSLIQQSTKKYLPGLDQVLQKLSKKQLIERLKTHASPLLEKKENGLYRGEALFYHILQNWPDQGKRYCIFSFFSKALDPKANKEGIAIPALISSVEKFLGNRS
jgi:hypothetical protein